MNVLCAEKLYQGERTAAQEVERQSRGKREEMVRRLKEPFVKSAAAIAGDGLDRQRQMPLQQKGERRTSLQALGTMRRSVVNHILQPVRAGLRSPSGQYRLSAHCMRTGLLCRSDSDSD